MPALDHISISGFKSIASIEKLPLGPINIIIGANGSGKTNFIEALTFLHAVQNGWIREYVSRAGGANKLLHFGSKVTDRIRIEFSFQNDLHKYYLRTHTINDDALFAVVSLGILHDSHKEVPIYEFAPQSNSSISRNNLAVIDIANFLHTVLASWRHYHFHDTSENSPLKLMNDLHDNYFLRPNGSNLAAFLFLLQQKHPTSYAMIRKTIQRIAPFFDDFILQPLKLNENKIRLEWRHVGSDAYFDASSLSDGTLRFMALATLFLQPETFRPSIILIDEPELGLHPSAITLLASLIKQVSVETQVIVSTQSSLLLDHFSPNDVLVAERFKGGTVMRRLEESQLRDWLDDYSLGQLWEKNELGGRPAKESAHV